MLRPRTVFRFIFYATLSWLALAALYVGLPSFSRHDNGTDYATNVLKSGRTLTRVYRQAKKDASLLLHMLMDLSRAEEFFPAGHFASYTSNNEERSNIALTFKIDHASDLLVICGNGRVPLSRPAALTPIQQQEEENEGYVRLETPVHVSALAGDTDGVNLPWFDTADAMLMFYLISRDEVLVNLHAVFKQGGTKLELWPGRGNWTGLPVPQNEYPLLSLTLDSSHDGDRRVLMASAPPPPLSLSPTPTYPIRFTLLLVLAPLTIGGLAIYMGIVFVLYAVLNLFFRLFWIWAFSLLVCWLYKGRPPVDDFVNDVINDIAGIFAKVRNWMSRSLSSRAGDEEKQAPPGQQASHTEFESKS